MKSLYKITRKNGNVELIEVKTNHVMMVDKDYDNVYFMYVKLKNGAGFQGFTPKFMVRHNEQTRALSKRTSNNS